MLSSEANLLVEFQSASQPPQRLAVTELLANLRSEDAYLLDEIAICIARDRFCVELHNYPARALPNAADIPLAS